MSKATGYYFCYCHFQELATVYLKCYLYHFDVRFLDRIWNYRKNVQGIFPDGTTDRPFDGHLSRGYCSRLKITSGYINRA